MRHWHTMPTLLLLLTTLTLLPTRSSGASLELATCAVPGTAEPARCGTLQVFEDRAAARGRKIPLKIVLFPAKSGRPEPDPLFILAGGPGQSATEFAGVLIRDFAFAHERRAIVFVDQRGTGGSNPLQCPLGGSFDEIVQSVAVGVDADLPAVRACRAELERRADLRFYTTPFAMDDLDDVRKALGYERINLWAASYGTRGAGLHAAASRHRAQRHSACVGRRRFEAAGHGCARWPAGAGSPVRRLRRRQRLPDRASQS
jgi:pimeloyl-ACP methyl ester carboxylesterase